MDNTLTSVLAVLGGSIVGASTPVLSNFVLQRSLTQRELTNRELAQREELYSEFIRQGTLCYAKALTQSLDHLEEIVAMYALVNRIRLFASGPVLDAAGGLLGISTFGPRRRVLVIPTTTVEGVIEPLLNKGRVERGWLGLALQPVLVPEATQAEAGQSRGLMIMSVAKDGPAARAGVLVGDILVTLGGEGVSHPAMMAQRLGPEVVGQPIELRLLRAGKLLSIVPTVAVRPSG